MHWYICRKKFHSLSRCEAHAELRKTFIPEYYRKQPTLEKLLLLQTDDVHTINSICIESY